MPITGLQVITDAMQLNNALPAGESPTAVEQTDFLRVLNRMLDNWSAQRYVVPVLEAENFPLSAGVSSRTWGSGGQFATTRPIEVIHAHVRDAAGVDYPVHVKKWEQYQDLALKSHSARPECAIYRATYPLGTVYFYPVPEASYTLYVDSLKPIGALADVSTTLNLSPEYEEAVVYNLAVRLSPFLNTNLRADVVVTAKRSLDVIKRSRAAEAVVPVAVATELQGSGVWRVESGEYL